MNRAAIVVTGLLLTGLGFSLLGKTSRTSNRYELSNERVRVAFDSRGTLAELTNLQTGNRYVTQPAYAPWRMYYRSADAYGLEIHPEGQNVSITRVGDRSLVLSYESLKASTPRQGHSRSLRIGLSVQVSLEGEQLLWTAKIANRETESGVEVTEVWLPWIVGIGDLGKGPATDVLYWPEGTGRRIVNPRAQYPHAFRLTYPYLASMQWFTLNNGSEGIYFGSHDKTLMTSCLNVMVDGNGALGASIVKYPFVKAGETWSSEPAVVQLYHGDWHKAAKTYRSWTNTWMQPQEPPRWIWRIPGWFLTNLKIQTGHINSVYAELPAILKQAQSVGINVVVCLGWTKQGFDNLYPHYEPDDEMGGADGLKKALAEIRQAGGRTILYTNGHLIDPTTEFYREKGRRMAAKDIWGDDYREQYVGGRGGTFRDLLVNKHFSIACPSSFGWLEQLVTQFDKVRSYGAEGIIYDQMGGRPPYICFSKNHSHDRPSLAFGPGRVGNWQRLRKSIKAHGFEFAIVTENVADCFVGWADITHGAHSGCYPGPGSFGELFRYTFPELVITNRRGGPYRNNSRKLFGHAFSLGLRFRVRVEHTQDPPVAAYLRRLCELRSKFAALLLEGRFVDNEGFVCDNSLVSTHAFRAGNRMAVTLWNPTDSPQGVGVIAPNYTLETAQWQAPGSSAQTDVMLPGEIAVLVFRHARPAPHGPH